jgi:hypothetical protein
MSSGIISAKHGLLLTSHMLQMDCHAVVQAKKTVKGGGLFGMFQQDTVYADESEEEAPPPPADKIERSITKRGKGKRKPRRSGANQSASVASQIQQVCTS